MIIVVLHIIVQLQVSSSGCINVSFLTLASENLNGLFTTIVPFNVLAVFNLYSAVSFTTPYVYIYHSSYQLLHIVLVSVSMILAG